MKVTVSLLFVLCLAVMLAGCGINADQCRDTQHQNTNSQPAISIKLAIALAKQAATILPSAPRKFRGETSSADKYYSSVYRDWPDEAGSTIEDCTHCIPPQVVFVTSVLTDTQNGGYYVNFSLAWPSATTLEPWHSWKLHVSNDSVAEFLCEEGSGLPNAPDGY